MRLFLLHNAASASADLGQAPAGWVCFEAALPLYEPYGHELLRAQRFWVRGKLERVDGRFEAAEQSLRSTKPLFLAAVHRRARNLLARARRRGVPLPELEALVEKLGGSGEPPSS